MPRAFLAAAIQMDVAPAPLAERLSRADGLVRSAAAQGAQLAALPELFNTGYAYRQENYAAAETPDGPTARWMQATARQLGVHLAGTLLLREHGEIYNALLLYAPDGRTWRYDKNYPWAWERAYFRERKNITVAHTDLGDVGMLICWDAGHPALWRAYAGQVDWMLLCSCPPDMTEPRLDLPDGSEVDMAGGRGVLANPIRGQGRRVFVQGTAEQIAWLGVPAVQAGGAGRFISTAPAARLSGLVFLPFVPRLLRHLKRADEIIFRAAMLPVNRIYTADGATAALGDPQTGDGFVLAEVRPPEQRPQPGARQPARPGSWLTYLLADVIYPALVRPVYRRGIQRWGNS